MTNEEPKQWVVMRTDLKMRKGKMIAQGCHASMEILLNQGDMEWMGENEYSFQAHHLTKVMADWVNGSFTKVCVRVESEEDLDAVYEKAKETGLLCALITDLGLTEFKGVPTKTCCAIGPALPSEVEDIVGHLRLL